MLTLPTAYFPSIFQTSLITQNESIKIEKFEHFTKQTYRNRTEILAANGVLSLTIPLQKWLNHTPIHKIKISYAENWQQLHWKSILSAYRTSPFLEFYEDDLKPILFQKTESLIEHNYLLLKELLELIAQPIQLEYTTEYNVQEKDWRKIINPKNKEIINSTEFPKYNQVFESKFDFIPNLSILDLLFNLGPESKTYLKQLKIPING